MEISFIVILMITANNDNVSKENQMQSVVIVTNLVMTTVLIVNGVLTSKEANFLSNKWGAA